MAFDFAFKESFDQLGEAALLCIGQGLSGFFDFGVQGYVCFFSHGSIHNIVLKIHAILFFLMGCIPYRGFGVGGAKF